MMKLLVLVFTFIGIISASQELSIKFQLRGEKRNVLSKSCWDFETLENGDISVIGFSEDREKLKELGFNIVNEEVGRPFGIDPPAGYHTPKELFEIFQQFPIDYPTIAQMIDLTETYKTLLTHEGRRIYALKISDNVEEDEDEDNYLIITNHHARELVTPEIALNLTLHLLTNYETDESIRKLIDEHQIYIIYTLNPDGLEYVWSTDNMWRKNRRQNSGSVYGVDLNRNYPIGWDFSCSGSTVPSSETYRGPSAASEPETQTMIAFQDERQFSKVFDFHSYAREVRINYGDCANLPTLVDNYFKDIAGVIADKMDYVQARSCCMGGNIHYSYHHHGSLAFLVETATSFQPPSDAMKEELVRILPGTLYYLHLPIPVSGRVYDRATGKPIQATFEIEELEFELDEIKKSNERNGLYHLWVPSGNWSVTFSSDSHSPQTFNLSANEEGLVQDIYLG